MDKLWEEGKQVFYTYTIIYHFRCSSFFPADPHFLSDGYPLAIFVVLVCWKWILSAFIYLKMPLFHSYLLLKNSFSGYNFFFSFGTLKMFRCVLSSVVFNETLAIFLKHFVPYIMCLPYPFSTTFKILSLSFRILTVICLDMALFMFILLALWWASLSYQLVVFIKFRKFLVILSSDIFFICVPLYHPFMVIF